MPVHVKALKDQVDAVILTIRNDEGQAVAALLGKLEPTSGGRSYRVARIPGAARGDAIHQLGPRMLVLVGIAGAVPAPEFTLGDVMVATRIADLRVQALVPDGLPQLDLWPRASPRVNRRRDRRGARAAGCWSAVLAT